MSIRTVPPLVLAAELGRYARSRFDHLTDGRPLYIPGFDTEADPVVATGVAALYRHPYSVSQLPLLAVHFDTMLDPVPVTPWLVSLAHLAHHDCPACVTTWTEAERCAQELPAASAQFHVVETPAAAVLLHYEDHP